MSVDISTELAAILAAIYGEEVRGSIHDALLKMNNNLNTAIGNQLLTIDDTLTATDPHAAADSKKVGDVIQTISGLVAFNYNPASSYAVGDYCSYGYSPTTVGHIYRCTTAINGGEAWNPDHWLSIDFANRIGEIIQYLFNKIATIYSPTKAYSIGDFCTYGNNKSDPGRIYRCNTAIGSGGEAWNASHWTLVNLADVITNVELAIKQTTDGIVSTILNSTPNSYILASDGTVSPYNGWMATDYIYCEGLEHIHVSSPTRSAYNAFYSDKDVSAFVSSFTVTTDSVIPVPNEAKYFRLSNTNSAVTNSIVYGYTMNKTAEIIENVGSFDEQVDSLNSAVFEKLTTDNYVDNTKAFWNQGRWDSPSLSYVVHTESILLDGLGILYFGGYCYGSEFTQNSAMVIRIMDSEDNLLHSTASKIITSEWSISSIDLDAYSTAHHIIVDFTTNSANVLVNPTSLVANYRIYVGKSNVDSANGYYNKYELMSRISEDTVLPWYWQKNMETRIARIQELDGIIGTHGVSFVFITDIHWQNNFKKAPMLIRHIFDNTTVSIAVCGGDILTKNDSVTAAMAVINEWGKKTNALGMVNVFGNHDNNSNGGNAESLWIDYDRWYGALLRPIEARAIWSDDKKYFYIDNIAQKVRMIFLNTGYDQGSGLDTTQAAWMQQLLYTLESGWKALVFMHLFFAPATISSGVTELSILSSGTLAKHIVDGQYDNMVAHNAEFIGIITGHVHRDYSIVSAKGYPIIGTTCDANGLQASLYDPVNTVRTAGTITEQAFDVYHIDTANRKIYITRIGAGSDREFTY